METISFDQIFQTSHNGSTLKEIFRTAACFNPTQAFEQYTAKFLI